MTRVQTMKKANDVNGVSIQEREMSCPAEDTVRNLRSPTIKTPVTNQMEKRIYLKTEDNKIETWNVRTVQRIGTFENIKVEMKKTLINIMGLGEVRWIGEGNFNSGGYRVIYSGGKKKENEVALIF